MAPCLTRVKNDGSDVAENRNEEATRVVHRPQHTFSWGPDQGIHALGLGAIGAIF